MKKTLLFLSIVIQTFYITTVLVEFSIRWSDSWNLFFGIIFILSILYSCFLLYRSRNSSGNHPYLSITVLSLSLASLGWFSFINYLSLMIG